MIWIAKAFVAQDIFQVCNQLHQLGMLFADLVALHAGKALQAQLQNSLGLDLAHAEVADQTFLGDFRICRIADQGNHLVQMIQRNQVTFKDMGTLAGFAQLILRTAHNHFMAESDELGDQVFQVQRPRTAAYQATLLMP